MAPGRGMRKSTDCGNSVPGAYKSCGLAKDTRKPMDNSDYGVKAVDQVFVPIVFETLSLFLRVVE
jgi:hypothetical protein